MRKIYLALFVFIFFAIPSAKAQNVTLTDQAFISWLQSNGYSTCLNGNQLDTTCPAILAATAVICNNNSVVNLNGIQYFKALQILDCSRDSILALPQLPATLTTLNCTYNYLTALPVLPPHLSTINCGYNNISSIHALPVSLRQFSCSNNILNHLADSLPGALQSISCDFNNLDSLPVLPASLTSLSCSYNPLHHLPLLPAALQNLTCYADSLSYLPLLPAGLLTFNCNINQLDSLPTLPAGLTSLQCANNNLTQLPALPHGLQSLYCLKNMLTSFPALPATLTLINCNSNLFASLPAMPAALQTLDCAFNPLIALPNLGGRLQMLDCSYDQLVTLPPLPSTLTTLYCNDNHLVRLPNLPASLRSFNCGFNQLTFIPELPDSLNTLYLTYNLNLACLPQLKRVVTLDFTYTDVKCLPDYGHVTHSNPSLDTMPLCNFFNVTGCPVFRKINGQCFYDANNNCKFDSVDVATNYVKVQLYSGGALQQQVYTSLAGYYSFDFDSGTYGNYDITVDTSELPFKLSCPNTGSRNVTLSATDAVSNSNNFAFRCNPAGFDLGVHAIVNDYHTPAPGAAFSLRVIAGDLSQLYGSACASGISGTAQLVFTGPVHYIDTAAGALPPTAVSGDTLRWTIADFGNLNDYSAFNLWFKADSTARLDTSLCFTFSVSPTTGDFDNLNNTLTYCIPVFDSLPPNEKEVYPFSSLDTSKPWLTYTIRFQNKDSVLAQNLIIRDTLENHLNPATFQLLAWSAKNVTQIFGNVVVFNFPNINLPDSLSLDSASHGYIQYKVRVRDSLPLGTQIFNTAYIQFDTNAVVMTNTTLDSLVADTVKPIHVGINNIYSINAEWILYPNPAHQYSIVSMSDPLIGSALELMDGLGRTILHQKITTNKYRLQTAGLSSGVYWVRITGANAESSVKKLVVE